MWAVQPRFEGARIVDFVAAAAEAGFAGIEVNHSMDAGQARALVEAARAAGLEARSLHAPAPWSLVDGRAPGLHLHGRENRTLNLASLDEAERALAVEHHVRSIEAARAHGMRAVVVHLGGVGDLDVTIDAEDWLRARYVEWFAALEGSPAAEDPGPGGTRRPPPSEAWFEHVHLARAQRAEAAPSWLEAARRSLAALAPRAADASVTLGLEGRLRYHEFPLPEEAAYLLADHPPEVAGYWHDVGHAEVLDRLQLVALEEWRALLATRLVGIHIHDVRGLTDHRAPGSVARLGVDFEAFAPLVPAQVLRTFEVDQRESSDALADGLRLVRAAGLVR